MILLDTNVLSALLDPQAVPAVLRWVNKQPTGSLATTSVTAFELMNGARRLPEGARRRRLEVALLALLDGEVVGGRVLPVDRAAADAAAALSARRVRAGRPVGTSDTLIAGVALARRCGVATRNLRHFADLGPTVAVLNPFATA